MYQVRSLHVALGPFLLEPLPQPFDPGDVPKGGAWVVDEQRTGADARSMATGPINAIRLLWSGLAVQIRAADPVRTNKIRNRARHKCRKYPTLCREL